MDFQVLITDAAVADLEQIVAFVAEYDPAAARRLGAKLIAAGLSLR
jgi:plasmid stabilization system protein ParE